MILTDAQIEKAREWFYLHKDHVGKIITMDIITSYPPTDHEDKNNPSLWKANHWLWFVRTYI